MITQHLLQSTAFGIIAGLLTLAFRNSRAHIRYSIWFAASIKFLLPFSILVTLGSLVPRNTRPATLNVAVSFITEQIGQAPLLPSIDSPVPATGKSATFNWLPTLLWSVWAFGFTTVMLSWLRRWRTLRAALKTALPLRLPGGIEAITSPEFPEPGVYGIRRPLLLLPEGIAGHLSPPQLEAIVTHELCHIRRRDNLATMFHMAVEALFWFHPLVWWLGARLTEERELACDEAVLAAGNEPQAYAEGILRICELYLQTPLACVAGVTGSNLRKRVETILANRVAQRLTLTRKCMLAAAGLAALAVPVMIGIADAPLLNAEPPKQTMAAAPANIPKFKSVKIIPCQNSRRTYVGFTETPPGTLKSDCLQVADLIRVVYILYDNARFNTRLNQFPGPRLEGAPKWTLSGDRFRIEATAAPEITPEMMRGPMLQTILEDRFKLKTHREAPSIPVYALTVAKGGPKLQASQAGSCIPGTKPPFLEPPPPPGPYYCGTVFAGTRPGMYGTTFVARGIDLNAFAAGLNLGIQVLNMTGITGKFDFNFKYSVPGTPASPLTAPSVFAVIQEQLGLKLDLAKGPGEVVVIDRVEAPARE